MRKYVFRARLRNEAAVSLPVARVDVELGAGTVAEVDVVLAAVAAGGNLFLCFCTATSLQSIDAPYPTQKPRILRVIYLPTNFAFSLHKFTKEKTSYVAYA